MNKKNMGTGAGGKQTNIHGLDFEQKTYLGDWIQDSGFTLEQFSGNNTRTQLFKVYKDKKLIAYYGRQGQIYTLLKFLYPDKMSNEYIKTVLSKRIFPDAFIFNIKHKELVIFEKKWQQSSGSVDEKLQTAPYKLQMFEKLTRNIKLKIKYQYILSKWFANPEYRNIKEYYQNNNKVELWVEEENFNKFDVGKYLDY